MRFQSRAWSSWCRSRRSSTAPTTRIAPRSTTPRACRPSSRASTSMLSSGRTRCASSRASRARSSRARMPERPVSGGQHGKDRRRRPPVDRDPTRPRFSARIPRRHPAQQAFATHGISLAVEYDHGAVGKRIDLLPMATLGFAIEAFGLQHGIHGRRARAVGFAGKQRREVFRILAAAFETWPMPGGQRRHFVEEKQFGVAVTPYLAMALVEFEPAADPLPRHPAALSKSLVGTMQTPAAVAHEQPARRRRESVSYTHLTLPTKRIV